MVGSGGKGERSVTVDLVFWQTCLVVEQRMPSGGWHTATGLGRESQGMWAALTGCYCKFRDKTEGLGLGEHREEKACVQPILFSGGYQVS